MKIHYLFLIALNVFVLQAQKMTDASRLVMQSDIDSLQQLFSRKTFMMQELSILEKLNESVIEKRKADCLKNHYRPCLNSSKIIAACCCGMLLSIDYMIRSEAIKVPDIQMTQILVLLAARMSVLGLSVYVAIRLMQSLFAQASEFEKLYCNALSIKFFLQMKMLPQISGLEPVAYHAISTPPSPTHQE